MRLSPTRRNLGILAAIVGILQGLAWAAMSLAAIILHNWSPDIEYTTNYSKLIGQLLYTHFILGTDTATPEIQFIIRPSDFTIFMWIYFLLSIGWFALSIDQFTAITLEKQRQTTIMIMWGVITLIVCLIDIIFVFLLARDYTACGENLTDTGLTDMNYRCYLTIGIAMTIAARGFTVWILNLLLSIFMFYGAANIVRENNIVEPLYANHHIPRVTIPRPNNNKSFSRDGKISPNFSRSSNDVTIPRSEPVTLDFLGSEETSLPSFLSRGDKFSY